MEETFIIVHGWCGSPKGHWQDWLYKKLRANGREVIFPQFPDNEKPDLNIWLEKLDNILRKIKGEKVVICHSLGAVLWLHYAMEKDNIDVDRLILVSPPSESIILQTPDIKSFSGIDITEEKLKKSANRIRLVATEDDEYCPDRSGIDLYAKKLNLDYDILPPEAGHINMDSGYGKWESIYRWCLDEKVRLEEKKD